jgi:predicted PhzF superfamily epimerase YddE/YHI9
MGLVRVRRDGPRLAFAAPPLLRTGTLEPDLQLKIAKALALSLPDIVQHQWVDNGPRWCAVMLRSARQVLSLKPDWTMLGPLKVGVVGPHDADHDAAFEVRASTGRGGYEDPVTGSLHAGLAQWLIGAGLANSSYIAAQGTALQRAGRVHLRKDGEEVWVGGDVVDVIHGSVIL